MDKKVNFQSIDVPFPKTLYASVIFGQNKGMIALYLHEMNENFNEIIKYSKFSIDYLRRKVKGDAEVQDFIIVMKCELKSLYPLNKSLWESTDAVYRFIDREQSFHKALIKPQFYNLCVTPVIDLKKKKHVFSYTSTLAFLKGHEKELDKLMQASDVYVTPEAKNCAIYSFADVYGYDLIEERELIADLKN